MHTKSDSEVTSLAASSPPRSPRSRPPLYFVQSPSRDSHDGGDSKLSFHSTPILLSPIGSPLHPSTSGARHHVAALSASSRSRDSAHSLLLPHSSRSHKPPAGAASRGPKNGKASHKSSHWAARNVIHEEALDDDASSPTIIAHVYSIFLVMVSCAAFFFLFVLLFWIICRPSQPQLSLKNVVFHSFYVGAGVDASGVPTKLISLNCTIQLNYYNPSKYFGVHVKPIEAELYYSELNIAKSQIQEYYQHKAMRKMIPVVVQAVKVPIYGASAGVSADMMYNSKHGVPLSMVATLDSQYYVVGKLVRPQFRNRITCAIVLSSVTMSLLTPLKTSCTYSPDLLSPPSKH